MFYQVVLVHNCQTSLTQGLIVTKRESHVIPQLLSNIKDYNLYGCQHPSLLLAVAAELMIDLCVQRLSESDYKMNHLEEILGQHEYNHRPIGNPLEFEIISMTRSINFVTKQVAVDVCRLEDLLRALEGIAEWKAEIEKNKWDANEQSPVPREICEGSSVVDEKIAYLKDTCHHELSGAKYQEKRISALIQVVRLSSCTILYTLIHL
jgi:hypothetical protein